MKPADYFQHEVYSPGTGIHTFETVGISCGSHSLVKLLYPAGNIQIHLPHGYLALGADGQRIGGQISYCTAATVEFTAV